MREVITESAEKTKKFAFAWAQKLKPGTVVCLIGNLGSGKTTFTQGLAGFFGIKKIISPTFILQRSYEVKGSGRIKVFNHLDLYRLSEKEEALKLGWTELFYQNDCLTVIEWPEKINSLLPENRVEFFFENPGGNIRKIKFNNEHD